MYFKSRAEAGRQLAKLLEKYKPKHIVVVALGEGSSVVAAQVAMSLHANMCLYVIKDISVPGEDDVLAGLGSGDTFAFNSFFSAGQLEEYTSEYRSYIEQQRLTRSHEIHALLGEDGELDKTLLRHRVVILVADGLASGFSLDVAAEFFKRIAIKSLVIATPVASVPAVDRMHLLADEVYCLSVTDNFIGVNHYFDDNYIPTVDHVVKMMRNIAINWDRELPKEPIKKAPASAKSASSEKQEKPSKTDKADKLEKPEKEQPKPQQIKVPVQADNEPEADPTLLVVEH